MSAVELDDEIAWPMAPSRSRLFSTSHTLLHRFELTFCDRGLSNIGEFTTHQGYSGELSKVAHRRRMWHV